MVHIGYFFAGPCLEFNLESFPTLKAIISLALSFKLRRKMPAFLLGNHMLQWWGFL